MRLYEQRYLNAKKVETRTRHANWEHGAQIAQTICPDVSCIRRILYKFADLSRHNSTMGNYIVSARKYRPTNFDDVVGQHALTTTLKNAIAAGKLAHAYLFCGPRGVGKTTCARIFAKTINCLHPGPGGEACGECESCQAFQAGRSLNVHELDAASNNSAEDIRALIEQVNILPQMGRYKVFIIDEVHMLSTAAANAFLKTLEEPPAHAIFILATTEKQKLLPTILSRCQIYDFNRMEVNDIVHHLKRVAEDQHIQYEEAALNVIAQKADGGMRDALSIFDQVAGFAEGNLTYAKVIEDLDLLDYDYYFRVTDLLLAGKVPEVLLTLNEILNKGFAANHFISGLAAHFRDLLVSRDAITLPLLEVAEDVRQRYGEQAGRCALPFLYKALRLTSDCELQYKDSGNKRLRVELTLIELAQLANAAVPAAGQGAKTSLQPVFQKPEASGRTTPQATVSQPKPAPSSTTAPAPSAVAEQKPTYGAPKPDPEQAPMSTAPDRKLPETLSVREQAIRKLQEQRQGTQVQEPEEHFGNKAFELSDVRYVWMRFANQLPTEETATAARMKRMEPQMVDAKSIVVPVENTMVLKDMNKIKGQLQHFFRAHLDNGEVSLDFRLLAPEEDDHAFDPQALLQDFKQRSEGFNLLHNQLRLRRG